MKKLSIALLFLGLFFTGCKQPTSPSSKEDSKSKDLVKLEVTSGFEYFKFSYTFDGIKQENVSNLSFELYENPDDTNYICRESFSSNKISYFFTIENSKITPGHEYTLKIELVYNNYSKTFKTSKTISTLPKSAPKIKGDFYTSASETHVQISWNEIGSFTKRIELYRSDAEDGEYTLVNTKDYLSNNSYIYDTTMQSKKTYWYKVISYEKDSSEQYVKIGESNAVQVTTGAFVPTTIPKDSITYKKGITSLVFEWPEVPGAEKYTVILKDNAIFDKVTLEQKDVTENTYTFRGLKPNTNYNFSITVTTEGGTSGAQNILSKTATTKFSGYYDRVKVSADQTQALYSFEVPFEDTTDCTVSFVLRKTYDENSEVILKLGELPNYKFIREPLAPATSYIANSSANKDAGYLHMTVKYKDETGNIKEDKSYMQVDSFYTRNLNPPTNLKIESISATEATISFEEISEKEKLDKTPEYRISAYDKDGNFATGTDGNYISATATKSPITLTNLKKGTEYIFKAKTSFDEADRSAPQDVTEIIGCTDSGIVQKPVVTLTEVQPGDDEEFYRGVYTYIKAEWDALDASSGVAPENLVYGLEYKIFEHSKYKQLYDLKPSSEDPKKKIKVDRTYTGTDSFSEKFLVNGGNTYTVRVYAYNKNEPGDIVYSDPVRIKLARIDDSQMYGALTYSQEFADYIKDERIKAGDIVDFANKNVWIDDKTGKPVEIRSSSNGYYVGYLQLFGEVEQTKFLFPSYDGYKFVSFKFDFEKVIENLKEENVKYVPRIILIDRDCFNFQLSDYGYISAVYYVIPNEQGTIIEGHTDEEAPYLFERYKMPYFQNDSTRTNPSQTGLEIDESWVFNNSIYMGVSQTQAGNIGFSYYY